MSTPERPQDNAATGTAKTGAGRSGTVGVYDRPDSADKPSKLPKVITAVIVVAMLVLTYLFWPKSMAPSTRDAAPPAATSAPADTTPSTGSGSTPGGMGAANGAGAPPGTSSGTGTASGGSSATTTSK